MDFGGAGAFAETAGAAAGAARGAAGFELGVALGALRATGRGAGADGAAEPGVGSRGVEVEAGREDESRVVVRGLAGVACAFAGEADAVSRAEVVDEFGAEVGELTVEPAGDTDGAASGCASAPSVPRRVLLVFDAGAAGGFGAAPDPPRLAAGFGSEIEKT
jgi:hypothetical protein